MALIKHIIMDLLVIIIKYEYILKKSNKINSNSIETKSNNILNEKMKLKMRFYWWLYGKLV